MRSTLDNNSGHQIESLSPMKSGLMQSRKADARSFLTNFDLDLKDIQLYAAVADARQGDRKDHLQRKVR